ncbi:energy transducer TonB [Chryseobacterium oranimense]|uniref:energy transducer TonB n=1 Tax=Chryseobacterium oranimense TaxID=421058 RepID=UPI0021B00A9E|nr:energy transducer TonB [Chryseobacterium oranimense]UWX59831.1 energy transducer TonB [Chryseobacterium oranimense]
MKKYLLFLLVFWVVSIAAQDSMAVKGPKPMASAGSASTKSPEFPGGHRAFVTEILKYFRTYPMVKAEIMSAKAVATFIVDTEGNMVDIKIESYEYKIVRDEFLRALKMVKTKWIPAEQDGKKVRNLMRQPLVFNLQ